MRKWLIGILIITLLGAGATWWYFNQDVIASHIPASYFIPEESVIVIEHTSAQKLAADIQDTTGILYAMPLFRALTPALSDLANLGLEDAQIIFCKGTDSLSNRVIVRTTNDRFKSIRSLLGMGDSSTTVQQLGKLKVAIHFAPPSTIVFSSGSFIDLPAHEPQKQFMTARMTLSDTCDFSILFQPKAFLPLFSEHWTPSLRQLIDGVFEHETWVALDLSQSEHHLWLNGVGLGQQGEYLPLLNNDILRYVPGNTSLVFYETAGEDSDVQHGLMYCPERLYVALSDADLFAITKGLEWPMDDGIVQPYDNMRFAQVERQAMTKHIQKNFPDAETLFVLVAGDVGILHPSIDRLQRVAEHFLADDRLIYKEEARLALSKLSDASATLIVRPSRLGQDLETVIQGQPENSELQLVTLQSFSDLPGQRFFNAGVLHHMESADRLSPEWMVEMDTTIAAGPWLFKNHITGAAEFVIQEADHSLSLLNANGRLLWKRNLGTSILGDVEAVDTYDNGKLQLLLTTSEGVYLIDRNGKDVDSFPFQPERTITAPAAFIRYSAKKTRLLIAAGKQLINIDEEGNPVKGWKPKDFDTNIVAKPQYLSFGRKDYLLVQTADRSVHFLGPSGKKREDAITLVAGSEPQLNILENFEKSGYYYHDSLGNIHLTLLDGEQFSGSILPLGNHVRMKVIPGKSDFFYPVLDADRYLTLHGEYEVLLDYTLPEACDEIEVIKFQRRSYVSITAKRSGKTYLMIPDKGMVENMPIDGAGRTVLADVDNSGTPETIVARGNRLSCYKVILSVR